MEQLSEQFDNYYNTLKINNRNDIFNAELALNFGLLNINPSYLLNLKSFKKLNKNKIQVLNILYDYIISLNNLLNL